MSKILIVVDMQNDFITGSLGTKEAEAIIPNVIAKIKKLKQTDHIIFTRDTHHQADYLQSQEGKLLPVCHCIEKTEGWEIHDDIQNAAEFSNCRNRYYVNKPSFGSLELPAAVNRALSKNTMMMTEIELIGLCTDICVVSNALILKAYFPETKITVDSSCCAGVTPEKHEAALETMRSCQINVI